MYPLDFVSVTALKYVLTFFQIFIACLDAHEFSTHLGLRKLLGNSEDFMSSWYLSLRKGDLDKG